MYVVAKGNSFITHRGVIKPGEEIKENDFADRATFLKRVAKGRIVAGKSNEQIEKESREKQSAAEKAKKEAGEKKKQEAKTKIAEQVKIAETALKNAQEAHALAKSAADNLLGKTTEERKQQIAGIVEKTKECEKAVKESEAALEKAMPEQKDAAEKSMMAAMEAVDTAKKELKEAEAAVEELPEYKKALEELASAADAVINAEVNLAEAKEAAAKAG